MALEQFGGALQTKDLDLVRAKGGDADLGDPDGEVGYGADFGELFGPVINLPVVPIERETMNGDCIEVFEQAVALEELDESGINGRYPAEHHGQLWADLSNGDGGETSHFGKLFPAGVLMEIPMRQVVRFVPEFDCFDHECCG